MPSKKKPSSKTKTPQAGDSSPPTSFQATPAVVTSVEQTDRGGVASSQVGLGLRTETPPKPGDVVIVHRPKETSGPKGGFIGVREGIISSLTDAGHSDHFPDAAKFMLRPYVRGVVVYVVQDMCSSQLGMRKAVGYAWGPSTEDAPHGLTCYSAQQVVEKYPHLDSELASTTKWPDAYFEKPNFVRACTYGLVAIGPCRFCGRAQQKLSFVHLGPSQDDELMCVACAADTVKNLYEDARL